MSEKSLILSGLERSVETWNLDDAVRYAKEAVDAGIPMYEAIDGGLAKGMDNISIMFDSGVIFLPQIVMASKAMEAALAVFEPLIGSNVNLKGVVIMGSVKGDIHEIGKNVCCAMLRGAGYRVIDLGCDVSADQFADAAREHGADIVGGSALMTTSLFQQKDIVRVFNEDKLSVLTIFGGAPCNQEWVDEIGGDGYSSSGSDIVKLVQRLLS